MCRQAPGMCLHTVFFNMQGCAARDVLSTCRDVPGMCLHLLITFHSQPSSSKSSAVRFKSFLAMSQIERKRANRKAKRQRLAKEANAGLFPKSTPHPHPCPLLYPPAPRKKSRAILDSESSETYGKGHFKGAGSQSSP